MYYKNPHQLFIQLDNEVRNVFNTLQRGRFANGRINAKSQWAHHFIRQWPNQREVLQPRFFLPGLMMGPSFFNLLRRKIILEKPTKPCKADAQHLANVLPILVFVANGRRCRHDHGAEHCIPIYIVFVPKECPFQASTAADVKLRPGIITPFSTIQLRLRYLFPRVVLNVAMQWIRSSVLQIIFCEKTAHLVLKKCRTSNSTSGLLARMAAIERFRRYELHQGRRSLTVYQDLFHHRRPVTAMTVM
jgi:hypothetical protein